MPEKRLKPFIVPVFIPNMGCPHRCVFCEQRKITAQDPKGVREERVRRILDAAVRSRHFDPARKPEVAFFGGTFTRLPAAKMRALLKAVRPYMEAGLFHSIRISTRPDAVDDKTLNLLKKYGVLTVELGVQSMDDRVLRLSERGHTAADTARAVRLLKSRGFRAGVQLMPGLPGDTPDIFLDTIERVIRLAPDMARIYPALVLRGTPLAREYAAGRYRPLTLRAAVDLCARACVRLEESGIPVIRMGLMSSPSLLEEGQIIAGPWHPAFGFLVRSAVFQEKIDPLLPGPGVTDRIRIHVSPREIPLLRGYRNRGLERIREKTGAGEVRITPDETLSPGDIRIAP